MTSLVSLAAEADVPPLHKNPEFMSPWGYAGVAVAVFLLLFLLLWAFRNTAARFGQAAPKGTTPGATSTSHGAHSYGSGH